MFFAAIVAAQGVKTTSDFYLATWSSSSSNSTSVSTTSFIKAYTALTLVNALMLLLRGVAAAAVLMRASRVLHARLTTGVFYSPMAVVLKTSVGVMLNRFHFSCQHHHYNRHRFYHRTTAPLSKHHSHVWPRFSQDFDALDGRGVIQIVFYYSTVANISVALLATLVVQPLLLFPLALSALAFLRVHSFFGAAAVEIRRLESACKAPMLAVSSFMFNGQPLLRAMTAQHQATSALSTSVDAWASMCVGGAFDVIRLNYASFDKTQVHT